MEPNSQPQPQPSSQKPKSNNSLVIIIIIIIGAVLVLGVGGYLAWKYYFKAKVTTSADKKTNTSSSKLSLKTLEATFNYPNGTITSTEHPTDGGSLASYQIFETKDNLQTIYNYYLNLATTKSLTVSSKSMETDFSGGSLTLQGKGYYADITLYQFDANNEIDIRIYGDNITNDTTNTTSATTPATTTPSSSASSDTTKKTVSTDYIISDSNTRVISESELVNFTPWELKVARNEIYARYGRPFVHKDLQCYFAGKSWYSVDNNFSESSLSTTENKNVATIQAYEEKISSPLASKDSGC